MAVGRDLEEVYHLLQVSESEGKHCPAVDNDKFKVPGLKSDAHILIDNWGVPHIYADSILDAYMAQGFQAARDRLYQIDLWRRRGLGELSAVFGSDYIDQDRATRLFLYRGDSRSEFLSYKTDARDIVTAFVEGINAYIRWCLESPEKRLPPEFSVKNYRPSLWNPEDLVRIRTHGLLFNAEQELKRALTLRDLGEKAEALRSDQEPSTSMHPTVLSAFEHLGEEVLEVYRLAFAPVAFSDSEEPISTLSGSNNWVVGPDRTGTGRPILANDPHRAITVPSLRYLTHLNAPELNVIGAGEPHLPGVSIGHNEEVAFGLTIWAADHEDLYVYELHPDDDSLYRYNDSWEKFSFVEETADVAGQESATTHKLQFTRHGPVLQIDVKNRIAVALRAVWLEPGMCPYLASLEFQQSKNTEEFRSALGRWGAPGVNMVYASPDGEFGWQTAALIPRRPGWDGSRPVPGDGRFEWEGFAEIHELPARHNPEQGWFTSSNENNIPSTHDSDSLTITTDWFSSARHKALVDWLANDENVSIESSLAWQTSAANNTAVELLTVLKEVEPQSCQEEWAALQNWDGNETVDSFEALLFQVWERGHFFPWLVDAALDKCGFSSAEVQKTRGRFLRPDSLFSDMRSEFKMLRLFDSASSADMIVLQEGVEQSIGSALEEIATLLGPDPSNWKWGNLHQTRIVHPLLSTTASLPREWGELTSIPRPGSGDTVGLMGYDAKYNALAGSSFRMAIDVGAWDESRAINMPGQSGDPRSPHYCDLLAQWSEDKTFPLLYTREAIEKSTSRRIQLFAVNGE